MVINEEVYRRMSIKQSLVVDIVRRQMSFLGHVLRKEEVEYLVVTGFVDGKRARGRQRETFLTYLGKFTNKPPMKLLRLAKDRVVWSKLCAEQIERWYLYSGLTTQEIQVLIDFICTKDIMPIP